MSLEAITWAFKQDLTMAEKMVLVCLADHTNQDNECWPSQVYLAKKAGASRSTVNRSLKNLEALGFIARKQRMRTKGGKDKTIYTLAVDECPTQTHSNVPHSDTPSPTVTPSNVPHGDMYINPNTKPSLEPNRRTSLEEAYQLWNDLAAEIPTIPKARAIQGPAQDNLKARLRLGGIEGFKLALAGVRKSPNHQNINGWNGFNLGWMVENPKKYERMQNLADAPDSEPPPINGNTRPNQSQKDDAAALQALEMLRNDERLQ